MAACAPRNSNANQICSFPEANLIAETKVEIWCTGTPQYA